MRVIGTETEFGVYRPGNPHANAIVMSTVAVKAYADRSRGAELPGAAPVEWDYRGEDPLNDLRGRRLDRASADPSLLTDDPYHLAPSGGVELLERPSEEELAQLRPTAMVLANGARLYVDHAHPEYSAPEAADPLEAVLYDRAGEVIARRIMEANDRAGDPELVLVKNNVDGKGASYGSHENYQVSRGTDLDDLVRAMIPFLVTRPIFCGAGRVGLGQASEEAGFQISQRADYVENDIGLETTFNRPIFNTRDEPHADGHIWRRVHVIGGDANQFDVSTFLRIGTTSLVLWAIEQGVDMTWEGLDLAAPVAAAHQVSRDLSLKQPLQMLDGREMTAIDVQHRFLDLVKAAFSAVGRRPDPVQQQVLDRWQQALDGLNRDPVSLAGQVEWIAKYQLLERQRQRLGARWDDARLAAFDLQWADLRDDKSLVLALEKRGLVERLFSWEQVERAADQPPTRTRAAARGKAVATRVDLVKASWTSLVFDSPAEGVHRRVPLADPSAVDPFGTSPREADSADTEPGKE